MGTSDDRVYSAKSEDLISAFSMAASVLSFVGASFVLWNYWKFENLRTFAFKLIFFVAIGNVINCIGKFMGSPSGKEQRGLCVLQAMTLQFGDLVAIFWVTCVAWIIRQVLTSEKKMTSDVAAKWSQRMHFAIWPTAAFLCLLPFIGNTYGPAGGFCWIKHSFMGNIWRWLCFFVPLWLCIIYMVFVYAKVWRQISVSTADTNSNADNGTAAQPPDAGSEMGALSAADDLQSAERNNSDYDVAKTSDLDVSFAPSVEASEQRSAAEEKTHKSEGSILSRIKYYPFVLFCCFFFATIRRLLEAFSHGKAPLTLAVIHVTAVSSLGFCNAIVYALTPAVRDTDREYFNKLCCEK